MPKGQTQEYTNLSMETACLDVSWLQCHKNQKLTNLLKFLIMMEANILIYHA